MIDYRRRTYVVDRPYSGQLGYQTARPETNVKKTTPVAKYGSPVSYRPSGSKSYNEMLYLFPGYEGIRKQWFDSPVGGQGEDLAEPIKITAKSNDGFVVRSGNIAYPDWDTVRAATQGSSVADVKKAPFTGKYQYLSVRALKPSGINPPDIIRAFIGFDLRGVSPQAIKRVGIQLTSNTENFYFRDGVLVSIQRSTWNPYSNLTLYDYDSFIGKYFAVKGHVRGKNLFKFDQSGVNYVKSLAGGVVSFAIREFNHDYNDLEPGVSTDYEARFFSADVSTKELAPTLIINYKR